VTTRPGDVCVTQRTLVGFTDAEHLHEEVTPGCGPERGVCVLRVELVLAGSVRKIRKEVCELRKAEGFCQFLRIRLRAELEFRWWKLCVVAGFVTGIVGAKTGWAILSVV
jgi:hypothetical protein